MSYNHGMTSPYGSRRGKPPRSSSKGRHANGNSSSPVPFGVGPSTSFQSSASNDKSSNDFKMMDISIGVDIMEGLVMDCNKGKSETPLGSTQLNAVISCFKNVSSSRQIATHVPSLPLATPSASHREKVHNFLVRWPADFDPHGDALSTFRLSRLMKRDAFYADGPSGHKQHSHENGQSCGYVPEEIELTIGLMRGSEMVTLGKAILVVTGVETEEMIIDLPISTEKDVVKNKKKDLNQAPALKRTNSKLFGKSPKNSVKVLKPLSFPSDKRRKFHLTENAMIRLQVQVISKDGVACDESDAVTNGISSSIGSSSLSEITHEQHSSGSSTRDSRKYSSGSATATTDYSSREESVSLNTNSYESNTPRHSLGQSQDNMRSHKYHPHVPMDELQNMQDDLNKVHLSHDTTRSSSPYVRTYSQPQRGLLGASPHPQQPRSVRNRSSSNGRGYTGDRSEYAHPDIVTKSSSSNRKSSSKSRASSASRTRSFNHDMSRHGHQHSSGTPRAPSVPKTRSSYDNHHDSHDSGYQTSTGGSSRTRRSSEHRQMKSMNNHRDGHRHYRENSPRKTSEYYGEDTENEYHPSQKVNRKKRRSPKPPMGNSHLHENGANGEDKKSNVDSSPMTWLYDKMVGHTQGDSAEETVKVKNNQVQKQSARKSSGSRYEGPSAVDPYYRRPSPKRTMRV